MDNVPVDGTEAFWANGAESRDACKRAACDSTDGGSVGRLPIARIRRKTSANEREEVGRRRRKSLAFYIFLTAAVWFN